VTGLEANCYSLIPARPQSLIMASVGEQVGEVLLGTTDEPQLSQLTRAAFLQHAQKDEASGDYFLNEDQFIEAIAPESEDYVSTLPAMCRYEAHGAPVHSTKSSATSTASCLP
jgi:hypothetical protein